jgi:hypothetical protein
MPAGGSTLLIADGFDRSTWLSAGGADRRRSDGFVRSTFDFRLLDFRGRPRRPACYTCYTGLGAKYVIR